MPEIEMIKSMGANCYLVRENGRAILVDTGTKQDKSRIFEAAKKARLSLVVLTHGHIDHTANAAFISRELAVPVAMSEKEYRQLKSGSFEPMTARTFSGKLMLGIISRMNDLPESFEPSFFLSDGDCLKDYGVNASVIALQGHTSGSIGIITGEGIIVGDALMNMFSAGKPMFYANREDMEKSAAKISESGAKTVYFGHGAPQANRAW